jgi:hypothetical protein
VEFRPPPCHQRPSSRLRKRREMKKISSREAATHSAKEGRRSTKQKKETGKERMIENCKEREYGIIFKKN